MFAKTILEVSIIVGDETSAVVYTRINGNDSYALTKLKVITFMLYAVRIIWNAGSDYKPLRYQMRHILESVIDEDVYSIMPIDFAARYTKTQKLQLVDAVDRPLIVFRGKLTRNASGTFFIYTKLGSLFQYNLGARHAPTSTLILWQNLTNTLSKEDNEKLLNGIKIILGYFDGVSDKKWSLRIMNEAVDQVNEFVKRW